MFGFIEGSFLVSRTGDALELHDTKLQTGGVVRVRLDVI